MAISRELQSTAQCPNADHYQVKSLRGPYGDWYCSVSFLNNPASSGTQLKCLHANAHSMWNEQEKLETCTHLHGWLHLIGNMETWRYGSFDWSAGIFTKDEQGRRGGITFYVNDKLECAELCLGLDEDSTESLWVRIKRRAGTGDITVVCYRPLNQEDLVDEALYIQIGAAS